MSRISVPMLDRAFWGAALLIALTGAVLSVSIASVRSPDGPRPQGSPVRAWIAQAAELEISGRRPEAEQLLKAAARADVRFEPAWALGNFYLRQSRQNEYEAWIRRAVAMSYGDRSALFTLLADYGPTDARDRLAAAVPELALTYCEWLLHHGRAPEALTLWEKQYGSKPLLVNGDLANRPISRGFDWRMGAPSGVTVGVLTSPGHPGQLEAAFSGDQADAGELLSQYLTLEPNRRYRLSYEVKSDVRLAGIRWEIADPAQKRNLLSEAPELSAGSQWARRQLDFSTRGAGEFVRLALSWRRRPGEVRISGTLALRRLTLEPLDQRGTP
ncbi:MAG: hypothetical protein NTV70_00515 [Acidobacteria bacterium]|nr:hypothetical protein [Acidobacteriota bacterium]